MSSDWRNLYDDSQGAEFNGLRRKAIPEDLTGQRIVDIGGHDGAFARLCLDRGARRAVVVDNKQFLRYGWADIEKRHGVEYITADYHDWTEPSDLVICYNVLYHVTSPWDLSAHLRKITRKQLALCTSFVPGDEPVWRVWGPGEPNWEDVVCWKPTLPGLWKLLASTGWNVEGIGRSGDHVVVVCT